MSITKPSESSGKFISDVFASSRGIEIVLSSKERFLLSTYLLPSFHFYKTKELTNGEIEELKELSKDKEGLDYASKLLKTRLYSPMKLKEKLKGKCSNYLRIYNLLVEKEIYDIALYVSSFIDYQKERGYSSSSIKSDLLKEGVDEIIIKEFSSKLEEEKIPLSELAQKYLEKYSSESLNKSKDKIRVKLMSLGYSPLEISNALNSLVVSSKDEEAIQKKKDEYLLRTYRSLLTSEKDPLKRKRKFYLRAYQRKISSEEILNFLKEQNEDV